jgi:hypothetical protein
VVGIRYWRSEAIWYNILDLPEFPLRQIPAAGNATEQAEPALTLLPNLEMLQSEMTVVVQVNDRRQR